MPQEFFKPDLSDVRTVDGFLDFIDEPDEQQEDHWQNNASAEIPPAKLDLGKTFLAPMVADLRNRDSAHILDAGSGEGVHVLALDQELPKLGTSFAVDLTASALQTTAQHASPNWQMIRADMLDLPMKDNSLDGALCYGVLHLTPDPKAAVASLARVVKPGGLIGVWVFAGENKFIDKMLSLVRGMTKLLGARGTMLLANILVPIYGFIPTQSGLSLRNSTWRQVREVMMSNFSPPVIHRIDAETLRGWFDAAGCDFETDDRNKPTTIWARKRGQNEAS